MTGEIERDEERREKTSNPTERGEGETSQQHHLCFIVVFFTLAQRELLSGENEGFLCYCFFSLPLPPKWTVLFLGFFFPSFLSGVGISSHFMILPVPPFLSHNPLMGCFAFFSFALFLRGRGWPGHTSTAGQPISSPTFISLSCLMLKNFHTGELCQIV